MIIFFTSGHYYFFEKLKIEEKNLRKLNCSYDRVSHALKVKFLHYEYLFINLKVYESKKRGQPPPRLAKTSRDNTWEYIKYYL